MRFLVIAFVALLLAACNSDNNKPDVSDIKVDVKIDRFEQRFFAIDTSNILQGIQDLNGAYPNFTTFYLQQIIGLSPQVTTDTFQMVMKNIISGYRPINDSIQKKYPDLKWLKNELDDNFRYVKHYYPMYRIPNIITFIATFDAPGVVYTPQYLGIGLQQYAGKTFSAYQDPQVQQIYPTYISRRFDKEYMTVNVMKAVVDDIYPDTTDNAKLIELMIEKGKQWWLLEKFVPDAHDSLITGFSKKQTEWCRKEEGNIWGSILQSTPDLYTMDQERIQNYIGESPRTTDMPEGSPGNIGQWVGWQIVKKFEEKNPKMTVPQVLATPASTIFQEAKYRPK
jgi:hypothetical protein